MKKLMTFTACLLMVLTACAQKTETRTYDLSSFNAIEAYYCYNVEVVKGNKCSLVIEATSDIMDELTVDVANNKLTLSVRKDFWRTIQSWRSSDNVRAVVTVPDLVEVKLGSAARLTSNDAFSPKNFEIELGGASKAELTIMTHTADVEVNGASNLVINGLATDAQLEVSGASKVEYNQEVKTIEVDLGGASTAVLSGSATTASVEVGGASHLEADDFPVQHMEIKCNGASHANVSVSDKIGLEAGGASRVTIHGEPVFTYTRVTGASKVSNR